MSLGPGARGETTARGAGSIAALGGGPGGGGGKKRVLEGGLWSGGRGGETGSNGAGAPPAGGERGEGGGGAVLHGAGEGEWGPFFLCGCVGGEEGGGRSGGWRAGGGGGGGMVDCWWGPPGKGGGGGGVLGGGERGVWRRGDQEGGESVGECRIALQGLEVLGGDHAAIAAFGFDLLLDVLDLGRSPRGDPAVAVGFLGVAVGWVCTWDGRSPCDGSVGKRRLSAGVWEKRNPAPRHRFFRIAPNIDTPLVLCTASGDKLTTNPVKVDETSINLGDLNGAKGSTTFSLKRDLLKNPEASSFFLLIGYSI